jgi:hypothetical protein
MEDRIDRAVRTIFLRRKLHFIEARRNKNSKLKSIVSRLEYPKTDRGRRRFIQDSLNPDNKPRGKFCYCLVILLGLSGMVVSFVICLHDKGSFLLAILSMVAVLLGIAGTGRGES